MAWISKRRPLVSICVPAYQSQDFIAKVLDHALAQTVSDTEIVISNDGGHPIPALAPNLSNPKIRVRNQRHRLGWVRNTNAALEMARGDYFMVLPHDDLIRPTYLEECLAVLTSDPGVFSAYSDIELSLKVLTASEVLGDQRQRIEHVMRNLFNGYSYRAVMRRNPKDWPRLKMRENLPTNFCADTTWILQQAQFGEMRRVPKPLYYKEYHGDNTSKKWKQLTPAALRGAWEHHCETLRQIAYGVEPDRPWVDALVTHRLDPTRVCEAPSYIPQAGAGDASRADPVTN